MGRCTYPSFIEKHYVTNALNVECSVQRNIFNSIPSSLPAEYEVYGCPYSSGFPKHPVHGTS